MGARAQAMGYASACLFDTWALHNNIAGLSKIKRATGAFSYHAIPSAKFFNRIAAGFSLPVKPGAAGVGVFRFGDDLYNEQVLSAGFANSFGLASLGFKVNYLQYRAEGFDPHTAFTVDFGGIATLTPQLSFGAYVVNINQPRINRLTGERIPTRLMAGIAFSPSETLIVAAEIEKDLYRDAVLKAGFEYLAFKKVSFRSGFNLGPQAGFVGLGFKTRRFQIDYSVQGSHAFGVSHEATVTCEFKSR